MADTFGLPPAVPSNAAVNSVPVTDGMSTGSMGSVTISAIVGRTGAYERVLVRWSIYSNFAAYTDVTTAGYVRVPPGGDGDSFGSAGRAYIGIGGLPTNTLIYVRLYAQNKSNGVFSTTFNSFNFYTNRTPIITIINPQDNQSFAFASAIPFSWSYSDPDGDAQAAWSHRYRIAATYSQPAGAWVQQITAGTANTMTIPANTLQQNRIYEWQVTAQDAHGLWADWTVTRSFYVIGGVSAPVLVSPDTGSTLIYSNAQTFTWAFKDPDSGDSQTKADFRYRPAGTDDFAWVVLTGTTGTPGATQAWTIAANTFQPNANYEWQVRTTDNLSALTSQWSVSKFFYTIVQPGVLNTTPPIPVGIIEGSLDTGTYKVMVYDRGGLIPRGEITPVTQISWGRKRDDISNCILQITEFGSDGGEFMGTLRSWMHEIVLFRNGVRVWEGPITRITYFADAMEIEAKDVMAYLYRRIMRQGYNDSYNLVAGVQQGLKTVTNRAQLIMQNALGPDDPNVLGYLTVLSYPDDAQQSRTIPDYSKTAWEEIDDLAKTAGLDYVTVGRRVILFDTHRSIGRLPEMRDGDFSDPPVVTEYGMNLATSYGVTNTSGVFGVATPAGIADPDGPYGLVELLSSSYGENSSAGSDVLTNADVAALQATLTGQAVRNIDGRWPTPLIVRVPDSAQVMPTANVGINQLIPGVWIPLRSTATLRQVSQWQKLDSMGVVVDKNGEKVTVTMSPAPGNGDDPDGSLTPGDP